MTCPGRFNPGKKDPVPIVEEEAGWAPGSVLTDMVNLASTGTGSPDHPGRSKSLYRLELSRSASFGGANCRIYEDLHMTTA